MKPAAVHEYPRSAVVTEAGGVQAWLEDVKEHERQLLKYFPTPRTRFYTARMSGGLTLLTVWPPLFGGLEEDWLLNMVVLTNRYEESTKYTATADAPEEAWALILVELVAGKDESLVGQHLKFKDH